MSNAGWVISSFKKFGKFQSQLVSTHFHYVQSSSSSITEPHVVEDHAKTLPFIL